MANYCFFTANKLLELINIYTKKAKKLNMPHTLKTCGMSFKRNSNYRQKKIVSTAEFFDNFRNKFLFCLFLGKQSRDFIDNSFVSSSYPCQKHGIYFKTLAMYFLCVCSRFPQTLHSTNITNCKYLFLHLLFKDDRICFKIHKIQEYKKRHLYQVEKVK